MRGMHWLLLALALMGTAFPAAAADKTVGMILSGDIPYYRAMHTAFSQALAKEGFGRGTVDVLLQTPLPDSLSWASAARKLVVADVNVLVTFGAPATLAAMGATKGIPIVFAGVYDPDAVGAKARNATGVSAKVPLTSLLKYLKKLVPYTRLAVVFNPSEPDSVRQMTESRQLEERYGFKTLRMPVRTPEDAKKLVFAGKADAVLVTMSVVANEAIDAIIHQADAAKIPTVSRMGGTAEAGVVLSLFPSPLEQGVVAAKTAARLLHGVRPASIPVTLPRRVELVLNLSAAQGIGVTVPMDLIQDATKVIP